MPSIDLPLFPLDTVLFPGGRLELRVFERRYLDLVRDCTREGTGFGVCLILAGREAGTPVQPAAIGTLAHIVDFHTRADGLLGIVAIGGQRFRMLGSRVRDNGLMHGMAELWPHEPVLPVPPEFGLLAQILERLAEHAGDPCASAERARFDDASWVGFRLAERLPITNVERQQLLQLADPCERLAQLMRWLPRFQRA